VKALAWSPDSQRIAAVGLDGVVQVWNALDGSRYFTVSTTQQRGDATPLAWSPDGQYIAIRGDIVQILRAKDGQQISRLPADVFIYSFDWSPDSHYLVTISSDNKMLCWNILNNNTIMWQRDLEDVGSYSTIKWSPSGRYIATTLGNHKVVDIWDAQGNYITTYSDHSDMVYIVAWQPNNLNDDNRDLLASGSKDQTMRIWEFSPHGISDSDGSR
jgi:WD40 repeat protein